MPFISIQSAYRPVESAIDLSTCGALTSWAIAQVEPLVKTSTFRTSGTYSITMNASGSLIFTGAPLEVSVDSPPTTYGGAVTVYEDVASTFTEIEKFSLTDATGSDDFGGAASVSSHTRIIASNADGSTVVVGAPYQYFTESSVWGQGAVYIFNRVGNDYQQIARLTIFDSDPANGGAGHTVDGYSVEEFGHSIALSGDGGPGSYLYVCAPGQYTPDEGNNPGYIHVFRNDAGTWTHIRYFTSDTPDETNQFGYNVVVSRDGSTLVEYEVYTSYTIELGSYRVYRWNSGTEEMEFYSLLPTNQSRPYSDISISDDGSRILTGNWWTDYVRIWDDNGDGSFASTPLVMSDTSGNPGYSVALCGTGEVAMVGDPDVNLFGPEGGRGAVFVFKETGGVWNEETIILCPLDNNVSPTTLFGASMDISQDGTVAAIGAPRWPFALNDQRGALTIVRGL